MHTVPPISPHITNNAVAGSQGFGPSDSIFAIPFNFLFSWMGLGTATAGSVYSFGYTLLVSIILNFLMGVLSSRLMLRSLAGFKPFRKAWLYGGEK